MVLKEQKICGIDTCNLFEGGFMNSHLRLKGELFFLPQTSRHASMGRNRLDYLFQLIKF